MCASVKENFIFLVSKRIESLPCKTLTLEIKLEKINKIEPHSTENRKILPSVKIPISTAFNHWK